MWVPVHPSSGSIRVEILGPLFLPMWRAYLGPEDSFEMDPLRLEGVAQAQLSAAVAGTLRLMRDYWSGALFVGPGAFRRGWSRNWLETPRAELFLSANTLYLQSVSWPASNTSAEFGNFQTIEGHPLPKRVELAGPGYDVRLDLDQVGADFLPSKPRLP